MGGLQYGCSKSPRCDDQVLLYTSAIYLQNALFVQ
jgi:hypothetical protein